MRFDKRFAIVVGSSLLWAFLVATLFYRVSGSGSKTRSAPPEKPLIVAALPLPFGSMIGPDSVKLIQVPETLFPKGGFSRKEDVLERSVVSSIEMDEPVLEARIAAKGSGLGMAPMIPAGMRAISVKVNEVVGVSGFVLPGMRVDVLVTGRPPGMNDPMTSTVLQNVPVLSAGQTLQADTKGQPISATVVTLLVNPDQAEALTLANSEGHIQLVLRNNTDQLVTRTRGRQTRELYAMEPAGTPAPAAPAVAAQTVIIPGTIPARTRKAAVVTPTPGVTAASATTVVVDSDNILMIRGNLKTIEPAPAKDRQQK
jgi:pilus assembly protein CpaB